MNIHPEFKKAIRNNRYEIGENGLYLPIQKIIIGGRFTHDVIRNGKSLGPIEDHNIMVNEGLNHILDVAFSAATPVTIWYLGIFEANYTPLATDTAANIASNATETTTKYDEAVRQTWTEAGPSSQSITNSASKATFTMNATVTIYGALLVSNSTKGGTSGTLAAASKFTSQRDVINLDELVLTYTLTAADA